MRMAAIEEPDLEKGGPSPITGSAATGSSSDDGEAKAPLKVRLEKLKDEEGVEYEKHCIFRVPSNLRAVHGRKAYYNPYNPQMVSIGPFHCLDSQLQAMQKHKERILSNFLERTKIDLDLCIKTMEELEKKARDCYAGLADMEGINGREFVEMMLLDACFILEFFNSYYKWSYSESGPLFCAPDPRFSAPAILSCIRRDLLMLENQIPLFVLESLFELMVKGGGDDKIVPRQGDDKNGVTLTFLARHFFKPAIDVSTVNNSDSTKHLHLLHIIWQSLVPSESDPKNQQSGSKKCPSIHDKCHQCPCWRNNNAVNMQLRRPSIHDKCHQCPCWRNSNAVKRRYHCASELKYSGVGFKMSGSRNIIDISFNKSHLNIPQLVINDSTESILLNLMAFEQCYSKCSNHVTSYVNFMDGLINRSQDVFYLQEKKIIVHRLGCNVDVAILFNKLCREIALDADDSGYLSMVLKQLEEFLGKRRHKWWAILKGQYLQHPWAIISIVAATLLLILTTLGALYAILSFHVHKF